MFYKALLLTIFLIAVYPKCSNPPPAAGFTMKAYEGKWYEIAKYQTAGGAYFEKDCKCT